MQTADLILSILRSAKFVVEGRLTRDVEIRYTASGLTVANLSLAVNTPGAKRDDGSPTDWYKVTLWDTQAEAAMNEFRKGDLIEVVGRIVPESWTDRGGEVRTDLTMKSVSAVRLVRRPDANGAARATPAATGWGAAMAPQPAAAAPAPAWNTAPQNGDPDDEEVPF